MLSVLLLKKTTTIRPAVELLLTQNAGLSGWDVPDDERTTYLNVMESRIANLCYTTWQGMIKHPSRKWVKALPFRNQPVAESLEVMPDQAPSSPQYVYGWDPELRQAWRVAHEARVRRASKNKSEREFSTTIRVPTGVPDTSFIVAVWEDNHTWDVENITVAQWQSMSVVQGRGRGTAKMRKARTPHP